MAELGPRTGGARVIRHADVGYVFNIFGHDLAHSGGTGDTDCCHREAV